MTGVPPVAWQGILAMLIAGLAAAFALAFGSSEAASGAVRRIRSRRGLFRAGGLFVVAGIVVSAESSAILHLVGLDKSDLGYVYPQVLGYLLILFGVAVLDGVMWWPDRASGRAAAA